jgi:predicted transcriptional regulator
MIEIIRSNQNITQKELAAEIDITLRTIQRMMKELQKHGKIERKGGKHYGLIF